MLIKLKSDTEKYKAMYRQAAAAQLDRPLKEAIGETELVYLEVEDIDKKILAEKSKQFFTGENIVLFISRGEKSIAVIHAGNAPDLLKKISEKAPSRGGGRDTFAMAGLECTSAEFLDATRQVLTGH